MKLFLSSIRLPNEIEYNQLFGDKSSLSVAVIPNAWDTYPEVRQKAELANTLSEFKNLGHKTSVIDLTTSNSSKKENLEKYDFIWVMGGNTFYLNYKMHKTGFGKKLKDAVKSGLVYGGSSAGAVISGPTIHGVENVDNTKDAHQIVWDGIGLVDFGIVPHWGIGKYADSLQKMKDVMGLYLSEVFTITNSQAIVVIDDEVIVY